MGCLTVFDLRSDNQTTTWLKTSRHLNKMYVRRLDEIEDFRFHVTHHPCTCNPTDPLSRHRFADGDGPALSKADTDPETQQGSSRGSVATHPRRRSVGEHLLTHNQRSPLPTTNLSTLHVAASIPRNCCSQHFGARGAGSLSGRLPPRRHDRR